MNNPDFGGEGTELQTPVPITNPPGLQAINYRVGTYVQFKRTMVARLGDASLPGLQGLTTRKDDDFSIALLDAWAMVAGVLTFYQERIANESYKSTATELLSMRELARMVNYQLRPGIAASAYLAFTLDDSPGAPGTATIDVQTKVQSIPYQGEQPQVFETAEKIEARAVWNAMHAVATMEQQIYDGMVTLVLQGTSANLQPGDALLIVGSVAGEAKQMFRHVQEVKVDTTVQQTIVTLVDEGEPGASYSDAHIFVLRTHASLFGHNATDWRLMPRPAQNGYNRAANRSTGGTYPDWPFLSSTTSLDLDMIYPKVLPKSWCVVVWPPPGAGLPETVIMTQVAEVSEQSVANYGLSARVTRLKLEPTRKSAPESMDDVRRAMVYVQSEALFPDRVPISDPVQGKSLRVIYGSSKDYVNLAGRTIAVNGELFAAPGTDDGDIVVVSAAVPDPAGESGVIELQLEGSLLNKYNPAKVTMYGNIALSTQGETVQDEILGTGDAGQPYQRFTLLQYPLIYTEDKTQQSGPGTASTLQVWVDNIKWQEVSTLNGHGAYERVFVTSTDDAGKVTVQFGDGYNSGSRLPSGDNNVLATYRKGTMSPAPIRPGQLSLLMTRPLGVKSVTNPLPASGGVAPDTVDDARRNADNTVLTLGRIVSLADYEDFARSYAAVAKARATVIWNRQRRCVVVTIGGPDTSDNPQGTVIEPGDPLYGKIYNGMCLAGDPSVPFFLQSYTPVLFSITARVKIDQDTSLDDVRKQAEQALRSHFSFDVRDFGQKVKVWEVTTVIQGVPGIIAVHVDALRRDPPASDTGSPTAPIRPANTAATASFTQAGRKEMDLYAALPRLQQDGTPSQAELLVVNPRQPFDKLEEIHEF